MGCFGFEPVFWLVCKTVRVRGVSLWVGVFCVCVCVNALSRAAALFISSASCC